jgi:hypothetical protein
MILDLDFNKIIEYIINFTAIAYHDRDISITLEVTVIETSNTPSVKSI